MPKLLIRNKRRREVHTQVKLPNCFSLCYKRSKKKEKKKKKKKKEQKKRKEKEKKRNSAKCTGIKRPNCQQLYLHSISVPFGSLFGVTGKLSPSSRAHAAPFALSSTGNTSRAYSSKDRQPCHSCLATSGHRSPIPGGKYVFLGSSNKFATAYSCSRYPLGVGMPSRSRGHCM